MTITLHGTAGSAWEKQHKNRNAMKYVINLNEVNSSHINEVGGKNASTGEMIQHLSKEGINIPGGFATTTSAYKIFLSQKNLSKKIHDTLQSLDIADIKKLNITSAKIRHWIITTHLPSEFKTEIIDALTILNSNTVAVRSSATAEDLPEASFAGQQETFLNVKGVENTMLAIKKVFASLFTSRAIAYRFHHGLHHSQFSISVGIQPMIRSDKGVSGVMFTLDTESGFDKVILINASYGLGESIVQGQVNPDEFYVYKPSLAANHSAILQRKLGEKKHKIIYASTKDTHCAIKTVPVPEKEQRRFCIDDHDIHKLASDALLIEKHYGKPMDIEWAKDGLTDKLYILQARPETVKSREQNQFIERYILSKQGEVITEGLSIGQKIGAGKVHIILDPKKIDSLKPGEVLVTDMTDPDWEPIMKKASAIVTNRGGRTCHAAIVARELGIPAVVGCTNATTIIKGNKDVTVSCAEGEKGKVYNGKIPFKLNRISIKDIPELPVKLCVNLGNPDKAFTTQFLPNNGVGLARLEFIISGIGIHPNAILNFKKLPKKLQREINKKISAYKNPIEFYTEKLTEGISKIAAAFFPKPVIFRFSDFKSNEYGNLLGGYLFEEHEENPMIGFRGASRYKNERFKRCFELECMAFKRVREKMRLTNAHLMIPFVRTVSELKDVLELMKSYGLEREKNHLNIYMMCEIPSNIILANEFLQYVDGFSIGTNDLTQLTLGLDRDSAIVSDIFDERNDAIKKSLHSVINECKKLNKYIGICGQGPSDHPDFAQWLMQEGIESISLNPDTIIETWILLSQQLKRQRN